jgi:hypothetical protein
MTWQTEVEKANLAATVSFCIDMWRSSGELDYLHKAIANIRATIEKENLK